MRAGRIHERFASSGLAVGSPASGSQHNASYTNDLGDKACNFTGNNQTFASRHQPSAASQYGTEEFAPLWHGPTLRPGFVAQVMGQVMMDHQRQAQLQSQRAYGATAATDKGNLLNGRI